MAGGQDPGAGVLDGWGDRFVSDPAPLVFRDVPAGVEQIAPIRRAFSEWVALVGVPGSQGGLMVLAVDAAMTLAVATPETRNTGADSGRLGVQAGRTKDGRLVAVVTSHPHWWQSSRPGTFERWHALVVERCAPGAEVRHTPEGTSLRLCWPVPDGW
jgi:hypothetical protein